MLCMLCGDPCWCLGSGVIVGWQGVGPAWQSDNWEHLGRWAGLVYISRFSFIVSLSSLQTDACLPRWCRSLKFWFFWFSLMHHTTFIYTIFTACTSHTTDSTDFHTSCYCLIWFIHMIDLNKHFVIPLNSASPLFCHGLEPAVTVVTEQIRDSPVYKVVPEIDRNKSQVLHCDLLHLSTSTSICLQQKRP